MYSLKTMKSFFKVTVTNVVKKLIADKQPYVYFRIQGRTNLTEGGGGGYKIGLKMTKINHDMREI